MRTTFPDFVRGCGLQALAALRLKGVTVHVADERETLRALRERRASIARYGDGELEIMIGRGIYFQEYDPELAKRLRAILGSATPQFLVGIPNFAALQIKSPDRQARWRRYQILFSHLLSRGMEYHSAFVSRPGSIAGLESEEYFEEFRALWARRDVVLVHNSAAVAGHVLFREARSVSHVPCLSQNAFREYAALRERATAFLVKPDVLFLIAAGPTAGVLAWDLAGRGAQALDIGHLTNAYDQFLGTP